MPLLAALAIFGTVFVLFLAFAGGEAGIRARLEALRAGPSDRPQQPDVELSVTQRLLEPTVEATVRLVKRLVPASFVERTQQRLILGGEPMSVNAFLTLRVVSIAGFLFLPLLVLSAAGAGLGIVALVAVGGFGVAGYLLPQLWLSQRVGHRQAEIIKSLPNAFDLITTCVEAGLGLDAALARVAEKVEGPFAVELSRMLRDISLGKMRRDALRELGERTGVPDLITFVNAVVQAELMGSSIGSVLRVQAAQLRVRRRQRAEEQAYKAPVKMLFPLVLCIFPTLFIVILGPAVITIMRDFPASK
jgi:tight adherence protein C